MSHTELLAIKVERRRIAIAAFDGIELRYVEARELSSCYDEARRTTRSFVAWAVVTLKPAAVAVETVDAAEGSRRANLHYIVMQTLVRFRISRISMPGEGVRRVFGVPALATRTAVRMSAQAIWPELPGQAFSPAAYDAAAFGLALQMGSLFDK